MAYEHMGSVNDYLEIKLALECGVESVGFILVANGNFDYTLSSLIETRNQSNWSMIGK